MKEIEHEKHAYVVRKGKNRKTKKKTTREQEGKREGILFYKKIPRIFSARGGVAQCNNSGSDSIILARLIFSCKR